MAAMQFGAHGVVQLVPALLELGEAFALELVGDVFDVDDDGVPAGRGHGMHRDIGP
jgi:hypothetical protein